MIDPRHTFGFLARRAARLALLVAAHAACSSGSRDSASDGGARADADSGRSSAPVEPPTIPVGLDAYRQWDRWPDQRIGTRAYMRSTYDRAGGNEGADASHFLYQTADDFNVTLDVAGPGVLYFARYNHWHGSPWHYAGRRHRPRS